MHTINNKKPSIPGNFPAREFVLTQNKAAAVVCIKRLRFFFHIRAVVLKFITVPSRVIVPGTWQYFTCGACGGVLRNFRNKLLRKEQPRVGCLVVKKQKYTIGTCTINTIDAVINVHSWYYRWWCV